MEAKRSTGGYEVGNKHWPAMERVDFEVNVSRIELFQSEAEAAQLQVRLAEILGPYGATVSVDPVVVVFPEDREGYLAALDQQAAAERN